MKIFKFSVCCLFLCIGSLPAHSATLDAKEIVRRADEGRVPAIDLTFLATVVDYKNRQEVRETRYQVYLKGADLCLVETVFPERQRGRKLLMQKDDLWFYTPDIKRATRVSMQQKLTGEVANGDLARTNFYGDYDAVLVGEEKINNKDAFHLKLTANRKGVTYSAIEYWVSKGDFLPIKVDYFAVSGKLLKHGTFTTPKEIMGKPRVTKLFIKDALQPLNESIITYSGHRKEKLDESFFNKDSIAQ